MCNYFSAVRSGAREHCVLTFNPLHFPKMLCSVAHELLIFSRLCVLSRLQLFWSLASLFVLGKLIASQGDHLTVVICDLKARGSQEPILLEDLPAPQPPPPSGTTPGKRPV